MDISDEIAIRAYAIIIGILCAVFALGFVCGALLF